MTVEGSATYDRTCAACVTGQTYSPESSGAACSPVTVCGATQQETVAPTASVNRECSACPAGHSCDGSATATPCNAGYAAAAGTGVCSICSAGSYATAVSASLDEKMAKWDATEDEQRASTLGGNLPLVGMPGMPGRMTRTDQPKKMDAFDVGMNLSGLILFPLAILLATFPIWIGSIDFSSVGPPPTQ